MKIIYEKQRDRFVAVAETNWDIARLLRMKVDNQQVVEDIPKKKHRKKYISKFQGEYPCPTCREIFTSPHVLGRHRSKAHGYINQ